MNEASIGVVDGIGEARAYGGPLRQVRGIFECSSEHYKTLSDYYKSNDTPLYSGDLVVGGRAQHATFPVFVTTSPTYGDPVRVEFTATGHGLSAYT